MGRTAEKVLEDIKKNPKNHRHNFSELSACCIIDGIIQAELIEAHAKYVDLGRNGGVKCDVTKGPCACGAWH